MGRTGVSENFPEDVGLGPVMANNLTEPRICSEEGLTCGVLT